MRRANAFALLLILILVLTATLAGLALSGCTARPPETPAALRGVVTSVTLGTNGAATLRVVWDRSAGPQLELDAADVTVTADTRIFATGSRAIWEAR